MALDGALPVRVDVDSRMHGELVGHLEGVLGWQVTSGDELPPALALVGAGARPPVGLPSLLLVRDDDQPVQVARSAALATGVLAWPDRRDELAECAERLVSGAHDATAVSVLRIGGAAGGVGTTTVSLALGGLVAWVGLQVLVVASGDVPVEEVPRIDPAALGAHRAWDAGATVPGVPELRVLAVEEGVRASVQAPPRTMVVSDEGVSTDVDLLVCRRDRAGVEALHATTAGAVVVLDDGPVAAGRWRHATSDGPSQVTVPHSARVARAGMLQRVPNSLPGRWLKVLEPLARTLRGQASDDSSPASKSGGWQEQDSA